MTVPALLPAASPARSAVADAYARMAAVYPGLRVQEHPSSGAAPRGAGWVGSGELAAGGGALDAFLAWDDAQVLADYGQQGRPDVIAGFGLHRYAWPACLLFTVPWFLERRVPRIAADGVAFHRTAGRMSVAVEGFACLPADPAAGLPGARVVPDEEALRAEVRAAVSRHLGPVLEGFAPRTRRGRRALWAMLTDDVVESLWYVAQLLGEEPRARAELELLLPGATAPYAGGAAFRTLTGPRGEELPTRDRGGCCFFYTIRPDDTCTTCPRTCDADRIARLSATAKP